MNVFHPIALMLLILGPAVVEHAWCQFLKTKTGLGFFADIPNARSSHNKIMPRGAGAPFALLLSLSAFAALFASPQGPWLALVPLSLAYFLLAAVGLIDDHSGLSAKLRLLTHFGSAGLLLTSFVMTGEVDFAGNFSTLATLGMWMVFAVACINLFNFADGINGFVGFTSLLTLNVLFFLAPVSQEAPFQNFTTYMAVGLASALVIFLLHNFVKKSVLMGDTGSTVLGLWQAQISLSLFGLFRNSQQAASFDISILLALASMVAVSFAIWIFADCGSMVIVKLVLRAPLSLAHREHSYQRLSRRPGWTHTKTTLHIVAFQILILAILNYFYRAFFTQAKTGSFFIACVVLLFVTATVFTAYNWRAFSTFISKQRSLNDSKT